MHSHHPRVTLAIATRSGAATLRAAIDSCLAQTYADLEVLVVDDGSLEGTAELLAEVADERLRVVRHETPPVPRRPPTRSCMRRAAS